MDHIIWLVLGYQVPVNPSKKRVYVWRKLKELGASYFRPGVAMLPKTPANYQRLKKLALKIEEMGGEATIAELHYLDPQDEQRAVGEFRRQSQKEYKKIMGEIRKLQRQMEEDPTFAREASTKIRRLGKKLSQIQSRDYFLQRNLPEVSSGFEELLQDMTAATTQLKEHISSILSDKL